MTDSATPRAPLPGSEGPAPRYSTRRVAAIGGVAAVALVALYLGSVAFASSSVPAGTTVLGVPIGGLDRDAAIAALTEGTAKQAAADFVVTAGPIHVTVDPADAGLRLDAAATVDSVVGRPWNPLELFGRGGGELEPVVALDQDALRRSVRTIAADTDTPAQEPAIRFRGTTPRLVAGKAGDVLDQSGAESAIGAGYLRVDPVVLPVLHPEPTVDAAAASAAVSAATAAVAEPVTVQVRDISATLSGADLADALRYDAVEGALVPVLDGAALRADIVDTVAGAEKPGRDARWKIRSGKPVVVPSKVGRGVNPDALGTDVAAVLDRTGSAARTVPAQIGTIPPAFSTADARALNITERLSTFTQYYPYAAYRSQNIGRAARYMDGTVLEPGDTYSMNDTIKERTVANGYTTGTIIGSGGVFEQDLGGGVSTATTATWTAAFFAGLERVHAQAHSIWISRYQPGLEATVAWGFFDMQFRNDTPNGVLITTKMTPTSITVSMWGTKVYDKITDSSGPRTAVVPYRTTYSTAAGCQPQSGVDGFTIVVTRIFSKDGEVVKREPMTTRYQPAPQVLCRPDPDKVKPTKKPKPSKSATPSTTPEGGESPDPRPSP
ncbi:MAG TPA: VanW family protein [Candidatus Nanopelagicales bacterium]|nr:VanW family protein [Candidatus Nanopelagicales bacterium]